MAVTSDNHRGRGTKLAGRQSRRLPAPYFLTEEITVYALAIALLSMGYGLGFEGYNDGKLYVGAYTPTAEYGWIITEKEIYLDTVFEKRGTN